jgi:hypothetical protein
MFVAGTVIGLLCACGLLPADAPPPMAPAALVPAPAVVVEPEPPPVPALAPEELADPADRAARALLAYHEQLLQIAPADLPMEIARLDAEVAVPSPSPRVMLELAMALTEQHNPGDLARAAGLVEPIASGTAPELQPWQAMARLLADRIAEQRRLEDLIDRQVAQRREIQHTIQQLTEKLEALKAIERSMTAPASRAP